MADLSINKEKTRKLPDQPVPGMSDKVRQQRAFMKLFAEGDYEGADLFLMHFSEDERLELLSLAQQILHEAPTVQKPTPVQHHVESSLPATHDQELGAGPASQSASSSTSGQRPVASPQVCTSTAEEDLHEAEQLEAQAAELFKKAAMLRTRAKQRASGRSRSRSPVPGVFPDGESVYAALEKKKQHLIQRAESLREEKRSFQERLSEEAKRVLELEADAQKEHAFRRYDRDGDDCLSGAEIEAFVRGEYPGKDLAIDIFKSLLRTNAANGLPGVPRSQFAELVGAINEELDRQKDEVRKQRAQDQTRQINERIAESKAAMEGVEAEVHNAEKKAMTLTAMTLEKMEDKIDDAVAAVTAATDFLSAATEQMAAFDKQFGDEKLEPEAVWLISTELQKVDFAPLEERLKAAAELIEDCKRNIFNRKKQALLKQWGVDWCEL